MGSNFKVLILVSCLILIVTSILNLVLNTSNYLKIYSSSPKIQDIRSTFRCEREKKLQIILFNSECDREGVCVLSGPGVRHRVRLPAETHQGHGQQIQAATG